MKHFNNGFSSHSSHLSFDLHYNPNKYGTNGVNNFIIGGSLSSISATTITDLKYGVGFCLDFAPRDTTYTCTVEGASGKYWWASNLSKPAFSSLDVVITVNGAIKKKYQIKSKNYTYYYGSTSYTYDKLYEIFFIFEDSSSESFVNNSYTYPSSNFYIREGESAFHGGCVVSSSWNNRFYSNDNSSSKIKDIPSIYGSYFSRAHFYHSTQNTKHSLSNFAYNNNTPGTGYNEMFYNYMNLSQNPVIHIDIYMHYDPSVLNLTREFNKPIVTLLSVGCRIYGTDEESGSGKTTYKEGDYLTYSCGIENVIIDDTNSIPILDFSINNDLVKNELLTMEIGQPYITN